ncbi:MAG: biopolymer transporter ExbD [Prevotella sp.]|jgi:biopolymer transport protein ExbD|nr:biopolymer transporter ExbD [Prevotella sp.]MCI2079769.1 biopolymer transporter ExbD [Prevotella sp.]MCI2101493.1 biopolymer transporter ExbD [Prevotella sp.]
MAKKESKQKKMNVRVDFTPMVDMLMLLITFFMLCTTLSKPQVMELFMPSNDKNVQEDQKNEAKASETVTLYVCADNKLYYGDGIPQYDNPAWIKEATWGSAKDGIRTVLRNHTTETGVKPVTRIELAVKELVADRAKNPKMYNDSIYQSKLNDLKAGKLKDGEKIPTLTIVIKPTDNASYKNVIDALDEMQILSIGTYVIDKINADDEHLLKSRNIKL